MNSDEPETKTEAYDEHKKHIDQTEQFTADAERYMVQTRDGIINEEKVQQYRESHTEAMKENNANGNTDAPTGVNGISHN
jgi:hypothetical protein